MVNGMAEKVLLEKTKTIPSMQIIGKKFGETRTKKKV
jgi:hypothetical protein